MKHKKSFKKLLAFVLTLVLMIPVFNLTDVKAATQYYIKVNKNTNVVTVYNTSDDSPEVAFTCSVGTGQNTPDGNYKIGDKYKWHVLFGDCYGQYCSRITTGILFHPVWYYTSGDKSTQTTYGYNKLGSKASHGCVRVTAAAAIWIYDNCEKGTPVTIFQGDSFDDPLGKPETIQVSTSKRMGWDPTDPDEDNPYETGHTTPKITVSNKKLNYGADFKTANGMSAVDSGGFDCTSWVKTKGYIDTFTPGKYKITFTVLDSFGRTAEKTVTYTVKKPGNPKIDGVENGTVITKELGTGIKFMKNVTVKGSAGKDIKRSLDIYIKKPGAESYELYQTKNKKYVFDELGVYKIQYLVIDPDSFLRKKKTIYVNCVQDIKPVHVSESGWEDMQVDISVKKLTFDELLGDEQVFSESGVDITQETLIEISAPDGEQYNILSGMKFKLPGTGEYRLIYKAESPKKSQITKKKQRSQAQRMLYVVSGDSVSGNAVSGDSVSGNTVSGDSVSGNTVSGDSVSGNTVSGDSVSGNTVSGDTVSGNTVSGDIVSNSIDSALTPSKRELNVFIQCSDIINRSKYHGKYQRVKQPNKQKIQ